jgi:hypothetical protein
MKQIGMALTIVLILSIGHTAHAKLSQQVWDAIQTAYTPAVWNDALGTAHENPDPSKFRNYVVALQGGIVVERAKLLLGWKGEYDYRGTTINLEKGTVKTRRGSKYTYLQPGDVMAVAKLDKLGNKIYMGIISPEIYKPSNRLSDKHFSRVTATVVFDLPSAIARSDDPQPALDALGEWLRPFSNLKDALTFAYSVGPNTAQQFPSYAGLRSEQTPKPEKKVLSSSPQNTNPYSPPELPFTKPSY